MSASLPISEDMTAYMLDGLDSYYVTYALADSRGIISAGVELLVPAKRFRFFDPAIRAEISGSGKDYQITLNAKSYAASVFLSFAGISAEVSDNFFDMLSDVPVKISVHASAVTNVEAMKKALKITSVYDIGK
jgi:hypothetical protein